MQVLETFVQKVANDQGIPDGTAQKMVETYLQALENLQRRYDGYAPQVPSADLEAITRWVDRVFLFKGLPTVVYAAQGFGKSYFLSWLLLRAMWIHPSWDFFSNLPCFWEDYPEFLPYKPPALRNPGTMSNLLKLIAESILQGRVPAILIDEMDTPLISQRWKSAPNLSWMQFTFIERHVWARGPVLVYHEASDIPHYLRKRKLVNDIVKLSLRGGQRVIASVRNPNRLLYVPGDTAIIPYATHGLMPFTIDVDMTALNDRLHSSDIRIVAQQIIDSVEDCLLEDKRGRRRATPRKKTGYLSHFVCPRFGNKEWCTKAPRQEGPYFTCGRCHGTAGVEPCAKEYYDDWRNANERYMV